MDVEVAGLGWEVECGIREVGGMTEVGENGSEELVLLS